MVAEFSMHCQLRGVADTGSIVRREVGRKNVDSSKEHKVELAWPRYGLLFVVLDLFPVPFKRAVFFEVGIVVQIVTLDTVLLGLVQR